MTEDEIIDFQISSITGHRPTWKMGSNHNASKKDFFEFYSDSHFDDPFGFFEEEKNKNNKSYDKGKNSTNLALKELGLKGKPSKNVSLPTDTKNRPGHDNERKKKRH